MKWFDNEDEIIIEYVDLMVSAALSEDIGDGDVTTQAIVGRKVTGEAVIIAKETCVVAGLFVAERVFKTVDKKLKICIEADEGQAVKKGAVLATVSGSLASILTAERVALNFLQRLCGIATLTAAYVHKAAGRAQILDTRKTTPGLRFFERHAVMVAGGENHRMGLFDAVLIKDNHIKAAGSVSAALAAVRKNYHGGSFIEVEVTNLTELAEAVAAAPVPDIIMLDNMDLEQIKKAVAMIAGCAKVEVSGGVTLDSIDAIAACGVDRISVGSLTHSARSMDISMEVVSVCRQNTTPRLR